MAYTSTTCNPSAARVLVLSSQYVWEAWMDFGKIQTGARYLIIPPRGCISPHRFKLPVTLSSLSARSNRSHYLHGERYPARQLHQPAHSHQATN